MNLEQIKSYSNNIQQIARKHGIAKVFLFGSVARGKASIESDIDFLVEMETDATLFGVAGFQYECESLLGVRVDVVPVCLLSRIDDRKFVNSIQRDAVLL
jgi:uncharacterized protein